MITLGVLLVGMMVLWVLLGARVLRVVGCLLAVPVAVVAGLLVLAALGSALVRAGVLH